MVLAGEDRHCGSEITFKIMIQFSKGAKLAISNEKDYLRGPRNSKNLKQNKHTTFIKFLIIIKLLKNRI